MADVLVRRGCKQCRVLAAEVAELRDCIKKIEQLAQTGRLTGGRAASFSSILKLTKGIKHG